MNQALAAERITTQPGFANTASLPPDGGNFKPPLLTLLQGGAEPSGPPAGVLRSVEVTPDMEISQESTYRLGGVAVELAGVELVNEEYQAPVNRARVRNEKLSNGLQQKNKNRGFAEVKKDSSMLPVRLERAAAGDQEAIKSVETDTFTEVIEQVCKAGGVLEVDAQINTTGEIEQFGQTTYARQKNTLETYDLAGSLKNNTIIEGQNGFAIEELFREGALDGKRVVEFSLIPDDTRDVLAKHGYYLREAIAIIRVTTIDPDGKCKIVSVLVGGTDQDKLPAFNSDTSKEAEIAAEEQALANRVDIKAVRQIQKLFGKKNTENMSPTDLLGEMIIIPDTFDHLDMAQLFDTVVSELGGNEKNFFFGLTNLHDPNSKPTRADYVEHERKSRKLQTELKQISKNVFEELVQRRHEGKTSKLMREIAKDHAVKFLVDNPDTDAKVYGAKAYIAIKEARQKIAMGDDSGGLDALRRAQLAAHPTGCPGAEEKVDNGGGDDCVEIINGQEVRCPGCKEMVRAIVPDRETIFCSNPDCDLAAPGLSHESTGSEAPKNEHNLGSILLKSFNKKPITDNTSKEKIFAW